MPEDGTTWRKETFENLPPYLDRLYDEIVQAYNARLIMLCVAGMRMFLEAICNNQRIVSYKPLGVRLTTLAQRFYEANAPDAPLATHLRNLVVMTNATIHELVTTNQEDAKEGLLVLETFLWGIYDVGL